MKLIWNQIRQVTENDTLAIHTRLLFEFMLALSDVIVVQKERTRVLYFLLYPAAILTCISASGGGVGVTLERSLKQRRGIF